MPKTRSYKEYLYKSLQKDEEVFAYLQAAVEQGDINSLLLAVKDVREARMEEVPTLLVSVVVDMIQTIIDNFKDWDRLTSDELRMKVGVSLRYSEEFLRLFDIRMEAIKKQNANT